MDDVLFVSLIQNLLHLDVTELTDISCAKLASVHCQLPLLQSIYTAEKLEELKKDVHDSTLYDLRDLLGFSAVIYRTNETVYFIGPYVTREFVEPEVRSLLAEHGFSAAYLTSLKNSFSNLPLHSRKEVLDTLSACIRSLSHSISQIPIIHIREEKQVGKKQQEATVEQFDYDTIRHRYEIENRFLQMIREGDVEHIFSSFEDMNTLGLDEKTYIGTMYEDPEVAISILRTLARKAAEYGGASVIEINEITQRANQKIHLARTMQEAIQISHNMLLELTMAVRQSKEGPSGNSEPIRQVVDFLKMNYSQKITLPFLAGLCGYSEQHLSTQFKKEIGMTITDYLTTIRLKQAARLLESEHMPIQEIASYVGYLDNNYFVKVFRKYYGMTPTDYRLRRTKGIEFQ